MTLKRGLIAIGILLALAGLMLGADLLRRLRPADLEPGSVPIYVGDRLLAAIDPENLEGLETASFVDAEEDKTQEGWLLRDILPQHIRRDVLRLETALIVGSSGRDKSVQLTWAQIDNADNAILLDLSGRGTLKLVSKMEGLDTRDTWVQDVDMIEVVVQ